MDSQGFHVSPRTHYGNGAANSSDAFGARMGHQNTMQQAQKTSVGAAFGARIGQNMMQPSETNNVGAVFDPTTGQNIMQQSQATNAGATFGPRMGQTMMQPSQATGVGVVFDPATGQSVMQQSQTTNVGAVFDPRMGQNIMQPLQTTGAHGVFGSPTGQSIMQQSQTTNVGAVFDLPTGQNIMQQSQTTNVGAAFGHRMGQNMMQPSQTTNASAVFDPTMVQSIMQQSQATNGAPVFDPRTGQNTIQQSQATNSGTAFGAKMGQSMMQQSQITNAGAALGTRMSPNMMQQSQTTNVTSAAFGTRTGQDVMQQSQTTNVGQFNSSQPNRLLQLQEHQPNALLEKRRGSPAKSAYEVGACVKRLTEYLHRLRNRPPGNNIVFWRKFVGEFYAPDAKKRLCVSMYGDARLTPGVFPQESWRCEICNHKSGRGLEANAEILPRLFKIKFESGALEEFMYIDMPRGYPNPSGQIVLEYGKATQESVFDQLRVVRDGQLRVVFSSELKICSWEFCARRHEELVPRRLLVPQIGLLGSAALRYRAATRQASSSSSASHVQTSCNLLVNSAGQLARSFEKSVVNELGYSTRYVRSLQISEVVNSMKDLIDQFWLTGAGPIESLSKYSRRPTTLTGLQPGGPPSNDRRQKRPLSEQPPTQNPTKKKTLAFPPAALQLMRNAIMNPYGTPPASTAAAAPQLTGRQGSTLLKPQDPRISANSPLAIAYAPSTPSSSMRPPGNMNAANPTPDATPFGQSNGSFGSDVIFIDDDLLLPCDSNVCAPSGVFQNDAWESDPSSVFGGVGSEKGKAVSQSEGSSAAIGGDLQIPMGGMGGLMGQANFQGEPNSSAIGGNLQTPMDGVDSSMGKAIFQGEPSSTIGGNLISMDDMGSSKGKAIFQGETSSAAIGGNLVPMDGGVGTSSVGQDQHISHHQQHQQQQDTDDQLMAEFDGFDCFKDLQF